MAHTIKGKIEFISEVEMTIPDMLNPHLIGGMLKKAEGYLQETLKKAIVSSGQAFGIRVRVVRADAKITPEVISDPR